MKARGPLESMRWQESGIPRSFMSSTASNSVIPGRRPKSTFRTALDVWQAAYSKRGQLVELVDDPQPVARIHEDRVRVTDEAAFARDLSERVREVAGDLERRFGRIGLFFDEVLPARDPHPSTLRDAQPAEQRRGLRALAPGLSEQAEALEEHALELRGDGADVDVAPALVADDEGWLRVRSEHEHRFFEARLESGQISDVGAVLAVGVDDEHVEVNALRRFAGALEPDAVDVAPEAGLDVGLAKIGKLDFPELGALHRCLLKE